MAKERNLREKGMDTLHSLRVSNELRTLRAALHETGDSKAKHRLVG